MGKYSKKFLKAWENTVYKYDKAINDPSEDNLDMFIMQQCDFCMVCPKLIDPVRIKIPGVDTEEYLRVLDCEKCPLYPCSQQRYTPKDRGSIINNYLDYRTDRKLKKLIKILKYRKDYVNKCMRKAFPDYILK